MQIHPEKGSKPLICPHCGAENIPRKDSPHCIRCRHYLLSDDPASPPSYEHRFFKRFFIITGLLLVLVLLLNRTFDVVHVGDDYGRLVYGIIMIIFAGSALASGKIGENFSYLAIWAGIFVVCLGLYSYRAELGDVKNRIMTELVPSKGYQAQPYSITFPVSSDGHYYIQARVEGVTIEFLADTGASHIVLAPHDARKLGLDPSNLSYDRFYQTANGTVRGSSVRLSDFQVGDIHLSDVNASVNEAPMGKSLLGMTFFRKLARYEVKNSALTLYWSH